MRPKPYQTKNELDAERRDADEALRVRRQAEQLHEEANKLADDATQNEKPS